MLTNAALFLGGLLGLYLGAEWLVKGAARLARRLGTRPVVIGLTIVAFGSSAPELLVGVVASARAQTDVVLGNVIGSNILNIALILGVAAMVKPMKVGLRLLGREAPLMVFVTVVVATMMLDGVLGRFDAITLSAGFVGFLWFVLRSAEEEPGHVVAEYAHFERSERGSTTGPRWKDVVLIAAGLGVLIVGAHLLVTSAVFFARLLGVSEVVIGLTVVAIGTSLPELATCVVAAYRSEPDIALGNVIGSNIFNLLSILAISALIRPIPVDGGLLRFEIPTMLVFAVILVPLAWRGRILGRVSGSVLVGGYVLFTTALLMRVTG